MNLKKIGLIVLFAAVTLGAGYFLFRLFFAPEPETPPVEEPPTGGPVTGLPPSAPGGPTGEPGEEPGLPPDFEPSEATPIASGGVTATQTVEQQISAPVLSSGGSVAFLNQANGRFQTVLPDGTVRDLSSRSFLGAESVTWSPSAEKAVIEFPDGSNVVFNFMTQQQATLPAHWQDFSFSGDGNTIAAKSMSADPENRWLIAVDANGSNARLVEHMGTNADKVTVAVSPDSEIVAFSDTGASIGFDDREVLLIGQNGENFKSLPVDGFGFVPQWSPSGTHLLFSASAIEDGYRPSLWFTEAKGDDIGRNRTKIALNTWADKCTFANASTVYCAVPDELPEGVGLQRDLNDGVSDSIWRVDLSTGLTTQVGRPEFDASIGSLMVSGDGSTLYMYDEQRSQLISFRLR